jgi:hypothetical protein
MVRGTPRLRTSRKRERKKRRSAVASVIARRECRLFPKGLGEVARIRVPDLVRNSDDALACFAQQTLRSLDDRVQ